MTAGDGLWARTRRAAYVEIAEVAMELFLERGFDSTTIEEIAAAAGISRRSFFRYFGTKEDAVLGGMAGQGVEMRDALEAIPLEVPPWEAMHQALSTVGDLTGRSGRTLTIARMMYGTPTLRARSAEKHLHWQELLVPNIRRRLGQDAQSADDPSASAIVAAAIACLDAAGEAWTAGDGTADLEQLYLTATRSVRGEGEMP